MPTDHQSPSLPRGKGPGPVDATKKSAGSTGKSDKVPGAKARPVAPAHPSFAPAPAPGATRAHKYIGIAQPLIDGVDKVTGRGKYSADFNFPDALAGAAAAGVTGGPLLLVDSTLPAATATELARLHPARIVILGSAAVVSDAVAAAAHEAGG